MYTAKKETKKEVEGTQHTTPKNTIRIVTTSPYFLRCIYLYIRIYAYTNIRKDKMCREILQTEEECFVFFLDMLTRRKERYLFLPLFTKMQKQNGYKMGYVEECGNVMLEYNFWQENDSAVDIFYYYYLKFILRKREREI